MTVAIQSGASAATLAPISEFCQLRGKTKTLRPSLLREREEPWKRVLQGMQRWALKKSGSSFLHVLAVGRRQGKEEKSAGRRNWEASL